jgi:hypothetical protein
MIQAAARGVTCACFVCTRALTKLGWSLILAPQDKAIFNDEKLVTYPQYIKFDHTKASYTMSGFGEGLTNIPNHDGKAFRFLKGETPGTVMFMNGEETYTAVKVRLGKAIATDDLLVPSVLCSTFGLVGVALGALQKRIWRPRIK